MMNKDYYKSKADNKKDLCNKHNIQLICLTEKDIKNLDEIFKIPQT